MSAARARTFPASVCFLAQVAIATPTPSPAPVRPPDARVTAVPTPISRAAGANTGLSGAATRVKLNRNVRFDDVGVAKPAATPATASQIQTCDVGSFKGTLDGVVSRFRGESHTAGLTPRSALAAQISKLRDIRNELSAIGPAAPACAAEVVSLAGTWMELEISDFDAFLGKAAPSYKRGQQIDKAWRDYDSARLLLP